MNTQECQTDSPEITLGDKFRIAREALHLSLEEVAEAIALRPSILKSLEENQFVNAAIPATFMRGYVRNYAKFLRIPESEWTNLVHFGHDQENDLGKNARATHAVNQYTSHHRWVGYLTALVVLVVIGMTGMWWWENHQHANEERDNLVNAYTQTMATTSTPAAVSNDKPQDATGVITATSSTADSPAISAPATPSANESVRPVPTNALQAEMDKITGTKPAPTAETTTAQQPQQSQQQSAVENSTILLVILFYLSELKFNRRSTTKNRHRHFQAAFFVVDFFYCTIEIHKWTFGYSYFFPRLESRSWFRFFAILFQAI